MNFVLYLQQIHGENSDKLRTVMSFYTCTLLGSLQNKSQISEKIMSVLVPGIIVGLKSRSKAYKAATYMILSQLAVQVKIKEDVTDSVIPVLTKVNIF